MGSGDEFGILGHFAELGGATEAVPQLLGLLQSAHACQEGEDFRTVVVGRPQGGSEPDRMLRRAERELPEDSSIPALLTRLTRASQELAELALSVEREGTADEMWLGGGGNRRTLGGGIVHILTHNMHHRAQALYLMEQLGLEEVIEGDAPGWEAVARGWGWADGGSYGRMAPG